MNTPTTPPVVTESAECSEIIAREIEHLFHDEAVADAAGIIITEPTREKLRRVLERQDGMERAFLETREFLGALEQVVCDWTCPSTWKTGEEQPHGKLHDDLKAVLSKWGPARHRITSTEALIAERDRLREALEQIRDCPRPSFRNAFNRERRMEDLAKAALETPHGE